MGLMLHVTYLVFYFILQFAYVQSQNSTCDRTCLESILNGYLEALVSHDPSRLSLSPDVIYVENSQYLTIGTGAWRTATELGTYRHVFADPLSGQVAAITTLMENGIPVIYVVRLKSTLNKTLTEIETQITRDDEGARRYEKMKTPENIWLQTVPYEKRLSRDRLVEQTNKYYNGMERNDPRGDYSFFHKDCNRLEDGLQTTNQNNSDPYGHSNDTAFASLGCEAQFQTGFLGFVTKIRDRRYPIIDEERQSVFAITIFDHNGTVRYLPSVNGTSSLIPPYFDVPRTLAASEAFRLEGEKLFRIEMTLTEVPYGMRSAFKTLSHSQASYTGRSMSSNKYCGRACLYDVLDLVLSCMSRNDTAHLPLAGDIRYSENGQFMPVGDGLWQTLNEYAHPNSRIYAARFVDVESGIVAYWGLTREQSTRGILALRIEFNNKTIRNIDAAIVRAETAGERGGTMTLMRPPLPIEWNGTLEGLDSGFHQDSPHSKSYLAVLAANYLNGIEKHSSLDVAFGTACGRRDNGLGSNITCSSQMDGQGPHPNGLFNTTTFVGDRRQFVLDHDKGVVMLITTIDAPATAPGPLRETESVPSTYMVSQLLKIERGYIVRVESMIKWMPFGYRLS